MSCKHQHEGGQNIPNPRLCGKTAKHRASIDNRWVDVCGIHARFWKQRGYTVIPIIKITGDLS